MIDMRSYLIGLFVGRALKESFVQSDDQYPEDYYTDPMDWYLRFDADILEVGGEPFVSGEFAFDGVIMRGYD